MVDYEFHNGKSAIESTPDALLQLSHSLTASESKKTIMFCSNLPLHCMTEFHSGVLAIESIADANDHSSIPILQSLTASESRRTIMFCSNLPLHCTTDSNITLWKCVYLLTTQEDDEDYRIFFVNSYSGMARSIICEVSKKMPFAKVLSKMYGNC